MYNNSNNNHKLKNISNCTIADFNINDIVQNFTVQGSNKIEDWWGSEHSINYEEAQTSTILKSHDQDNLLTTQFFSAPVFTDIWTPVFISANNSEQKISEKGIYNKPTLGTNEYISFEPAFKQNTIRVTNGRLVIPWKLNSDNFLFECTKGVLCWVKSLEGKDPKIKTLTWSQIPRYVPFYIADTEPSSTGPYIKIDEDRIMDRGPEPLDSLRGPIDDQIKSPNDIFGDNYTQKPYTLHKYNFINSIGDPVFDNKIHNKLMWIPIGDVYSYSENTGGNNSEYKSYISASLYQYYTAIYHSITIRRKRKFSRDLVQSRRYKNLAKYLASSPFITKFAISMMTRDPIQEIVLSHINGSIPLEEALINISSILDKENNNSDFNLEQNQLNNIVRTPTELINNLRNKYGIKLAINDGSITYSGELNHRDDVAITNVYSMYTKNADHYLSKDSYATLCQKIQVNNYSIESRINNSSEYSGEKENYRSVCVSSRLESGEEADTNKIRLFDSVEPKWDSKLKFNILMQYTDNLELKGKTKEEYSPDNTVFEYDAEENFDLEPSEDWLLPKEIDPVRPQGYVRFTALPEDIPAIYDYDNPYFSMTEEAKKQFVFLWEQVSGPPIKFTDYNLSDKGIYDTSSSSKVQIIFSDYARYTIKCTILSPFGNFVKYKTFFVIRPNKTFTHYGIDKFGQSTKRTVTYTEDPNILNTFNENRLDYGGPILSEKTQQSIPIDPNRYNYKFIKCTGFKKIAINARGLVWFIDTDFKVGRNGYLEVYIENLSGPVYKISCAEPSNVSKPYGKLSEPFDIYNDTTARSRLLTLSYKIASSDSTATVYVSKILLENIRDGSDECAKCLSTYGSDMIGITAFGGVGKKTLSIDRINNGYALVDFEDTGVDSLNYYYLPAYSLDYSPKLYKYGRYATDEFVDRLTGDFIFPDASGLLDTFDKTLFKDSIYSNNVKNTYYTPITGYYLANERDNIADDDIPASVPKHKVCYQKALNVIDGDDRDRESFIEFSKGEFHPNSGWILDKRDNNSYVLKFNPGARSTYNFNGPAIFGLNNSNYEYDTVSDNLINSTIQLSILPNIYSSSIGLGISKPIQWDPPCGCPPADDASDTERTQFSRKRGLRDIQNQIAKEYADQRGLEFQGLNVIDKNKEVLYQSWHGYRILGGGMPKLSAPNDTEVIDVNDEFVFNKLSYSRNNNRFDYEFAVTGPAYKPTVLDTGTYDFIGNGGSSIPDDLDTSISLRDPRINDLTIRDLEIKLNFLNYVNTQDLIVWLEVKPSDEELRRQRPPGAVKFSSPMNSTLDFLTGQQFPDLVQYKDPSASFLESVPSSELLLDENLIYNTGVGDYLKNMIDINSSNPGSNYKLYLLNQEYLQNNKYNLSLRFSDHASIGVHTNDFSISNTTDSVGPYPAIANIVLEDGDTIAPTLSAMNYNDIDNHRYSNIIKSNKLFAKVNTFSKLINRSLFINPPPVDGPCGPDRLPQQQDNSYDSKTIFTLKIAIVDEPDLMENYDNIINNGILTEYTPSSNILTSASKFNNLCNWEAVVHTEYSRSYEAKSTSNHSYGSSDVLSLINYSAPEDQQNSQWQNGYYGYNFITNMKDKEFLLPLCNINAPYNYIQDFDICNSAQYDQTRSNLLLKTPTYPTEAAVSILAGSLEAGGFIGGVGAAGSSALDSFGNSSAYRDITGYFSEASRWAQADRRLGQIYNIVHSDYPHGSAEKILLNISKDSCFWYNIEASIFKLSNTPKLNTDKFEILPLVKITGIDTELSSKEKLVKLFSEFKYDVIDDINDIIDPIFISNNISLTCDEYKASKDKNTIVKNDETLTINTHDIFSISVQQSDDEACKNASGLFILKPTGDSGYIWSSGFPDLLYNSNLITVNNFILDYNNKWWTPNQNTVVIKIDNPVLSDIMYPSDEVEVFTESSRTESFDIGLRINHVMKVLLDNKYYSVLVLELSGTIPNDPDTGKTPSLKEFISSRDIVRIRNENIGIVINPIWSSNKTDTGAYSGSQWGYSGGDNIGKDMPYDHNGLIPQIYFSTNSVGSYGDMSPKINKNYLNTVIHNNKIKKFHEIFNNQNNFRIKSDFVYLYDGSGEWIGTLSDVSSFHYPLDIFTKNNQIYNSDIITLIENTSDTYKNNYSYNSNTLLKNQLYEVIYVRENVTYPSDFFYTTNTQTYIKIPGVGNLSHPVELSEADKNLLTTRVNELNSNINQEILDQYSGKLNKYTDFFNTYPSIKTALAYYDSIVIQSTSVDNINIIHKIKNNLNLLYEEKNYLQQIIDINYDAKILAPYKFYVKTIKDEADYSTESPNKYDIQLRSNENYYWINIDPKQSCVLSEELRPKVLKSTKYSCAFLNPNIDSTIVNSINNNICPRDVTTKAKDGGDENIKLDSNPSFGTDFPLGQTYGYYIPQNKIDEEKKRLEGKYPSIAGWRQQSITRAFYMNSTADIVDVASNPDYVIYVYETYDIALPKEHTVPLAESLKEGIFKNDGSADINLIQGWSEACGRSPGGIGLLDSFGSRNKGPSRLCNVFNLDDTDKIRVKFRKIPRVLRGIDFLGSIFRYAPRSQYRQKNTGNPLQPKETTVGQGSLNNHMYLWECLELDKNSKLIKTGLPDLMKIMNEMTFRAFYGSVDGIEYRDLLLMNNEYAHQLIPFEFFVKPPPPQPPSPT